MKLTLQRVPLGVLTALTMAVLLVVSVILVFLGVVTVLGVQFAAYVWSQETPVLNISLGIPCLAIPIGSLLFGVHLVLMFRRYADRRFAPGYVLEDLSGEGV